MTVNLGVNKVYSPYLFNYSNRNEVYYGGGGSGKSVFVAQKLILKSLNDVRKVLVIRKVAATQKDSCFSLVTKILTDIKILKYCTVNKSTFEITLPNGSVFLFKGLDDSEKIKSITDISDIWIEEATEITFDDYTQLNLRLRSPKANNQIILSFNPVSKANWVYKHFFENETDAFILQTTYKDNRFLPEDYIKSLEEMKKTNYTYYKIYALGEFCSLDRLIFTNWEEQDFDIDLLIKERNLTTITGLDFGFTNDPTAFVVALCDEENKELYIIDEFQDTGLLNTDIANKIKALGYSKNLIYADSAEQKSIEEIKRNGIPRIKPCSKGKDSIVFGIQLLQQYKIIVKPNCQGIITELQNYAWEKDKSGEYVNKPIDKYNHLLDALRYGMQAITKNKKIGFLAKGAL